MQVLMGLNIKQRKSIISKLPDRVKGDLTFRLLMLDINEQLTGRDE